MWARVWAVCLARLAPPAGGKLPGVHPGEFGDRSDDDRFDHHALKPTVFGVVVAEALDRQSKQVHGVRRFIDAPAGDTRQGGGLVGHRVDDENGLLKLLGCHFFQVVHHRFDDVDKGIRAASSGSEQGSHRQGATRTASAAAGGPSQCGLLARHPSTVVASPLAWGIMRERRPPERRCSKVSCELTAQHTLTYVYADQEVVIGPLAQQAEPHSYDLCAPHAQSLTAPQGWQVVRYRPELHVD